MVQLRSSFYLWSALFEIGERYTPPPPPATQEQETMYLNASPISCLVASLSMVFPQQFCKTPSCPKIQPGIPTSVRRLLSDSLLIPVLLPNPVLLRSEWYVVCSPNSYLNWMLVSSVCCQASWRACSNLKQYFALQEIYQNLSHKFLFLIHFLFKLSSTVRNTEFYNSSNRHKHPGLSFSPSNLIFPAGFISEA